MIIKDIREWIKATYISHLEFCGYEPHTTIWTPYYSIRRPKIVCVDGFEVSIQGGPHLYSTPKKFIDKYEKMDM